MGKMMNTQPQASLWILHGGHKPALTARILLLFDEKMCYVTKCLILSFLCSCFIIKVFLILLIPIGDDEQRSKRKGSKKRFNIYMK